MSSFANFTRWPYSSSSWRSTGSTARHGPHHGAPKSTITGVSACRTSCSKVASVSSFMRTMLQPPREGPEAQGRDFPDRLEDDAAAHLRAPVPAVDKGDRHLDDAEAGAQRPVGGLDLEGVAA